MIEEKQINKPNLHESWSVKISLQLIELSITQWVELELSCSWNSSFLGSFIAWILTCLALENTFNTNSGHTKISKVYTKP